MLRDEVMCAKEDLLWRENYEKILLDVMIYLGGVVSFTVSLMVPLYLVFALMCMG
jgi:hypothetical protein